MPEQNLTRIPLEKARIQLDLAKTNRFKILGDLGRKRAELNRLQRVRQKTHPDLIRVKKEYKDLLTKIQQANKTEKTLVEALQKEKKNSTTENPSDDIARLEAAYPIVLLPVRLETRFIRRPGPNNIVGQLWVRIYPDSLHYDSHEPLLTQSELEAGQVYWSKAWMDANEQDAWTSLIAQYGTTRAAWIVKETTPKGYPTQFPPAPGEQLPSSAFPDVQIRPDNWCRPPEARGLPDRWEVIATLNRAPTEIRPRTLTPKQINPIREPLHLSPLSTSDAVEEEFDDLFDLSGDGLTVPTDVKWTFQLKEAEEAGMAVQFDLTEDDFNLGFQSIVVVGVKTSFSPQQSSEELNVLLQNHHYTGGLGFVGQGTPTNNTKESSSGFPRADPRGANSFTVERDGLGVTSDSDGARFMKALGLSEELAEHLEGADRSEQQAAQAMAEALWPATLGYYMEHMWAIIEHAGNGKFSQTFDSAMIQEAREFFVKYVRGRGPFPAFRIGTVPYGILPTSSWRRWIPRDGSSGVERELPVSLTGVNENRGGLLRPWLDLISDVPRVGLTDNANEDLVRALGLEASSREVWIRQSKGPLGCGWSPAVLPGAGTPVSSGDLRNPPTGVSPDPEIQPNPAFFAISHLGLGTPDPRIGWNCFEESFRFARGLVTNNPDLSSDSHTLSQLHPKEFNYIGWILEHFSNPEVIRDQEFPNPLETDAAPTSLLFIMLRHAYLLECLNAGTRLLLKEGNQHLPDEEKLDPKHITDAELVRVFPETLNRPSVWERLSQSIPEITGNRTLLEHLTSVAPDASRYHDALGALKDLPTAELERLFTETLDTCSHRIDAWITSLFTKRLEGMRNDQPEHCYLGAYGWVENLKPDPDRRREIDVSNGEKAAVFSDSAGYIQAPSMSHGNAAAVLRNGYWTRRGEHQEPYAVNLSSARVRTALWVLDSIREGQPLGAVLGYRFERGLHEGHPEVELDKFIDAFRKEYPLVANKAGETSDEPVASLAARNVVDGLALIRKWEETKDSDSWKPEELLQATDTEMAAIQQELMSLEEALDSVSDLLMSESVFQHVIGNTAGAGATLDSLSKGKRPPEPSITSIPRGGTRIYHRIGVILGGSRPMENSGWDQIPITPRAKAEPYLNAWAGKLLGNPENVKCQVRLRVTKKDADTNTEEVVLENIRVPLKDLNVQPLDVLTLAREFSKTREELPEDQGESASPALQSQDPELIRRITTVAVAKVENEEERIEVEEIDFQMPDLDDEERTFPQILEIARTINLVLSNVRPLRPSDLHLPEDVDSRGLVNQGVDFRELGARANAARDELKRKLSELKLALENRNHDALRAGLRDVSLYGLSSIFPVHNSTPDMLVTLGQSAAEELQRRFDKLELMRKELSELRTGRRLTLKKHKESLIDQIKSIFGRRFPVLPSFRPVNAEEFSIVLTDKPSLGKGKDEAETAGMWLAQVYRVRKALSVWRKLSLYSQVIAPDLPSFEIFQFPHEEGARWVGLPFDQKSPLRNDSRSLGGRVSMVLQRFENKPSEQDQWNGLLLDEWEETIPNAEEATALVYHYDAPGAQAPQAILLAVPPDLSKEHWDLPSLIDTLHDTLELAKIRAVEPAFLFERGLNDSSDRQEGFKKLLPLMMLADNVKDATVSTHFKGDSLET